MQFGVKLTLKKQAKTKKLEMSKALNHNFSVYFGDWNQETWTQDIMPLVTKPVIWGKTLHYQTF